MKEFKIKIGLASLFIVFLFASQGVVAQTLIGTTFQPSASGSDIDHVDRFAGNITTIDANLAFDLIQAEALAAERAFWNAPDTDDASKATKLIEKNYYGSLARMLQGGATVISVLRNSEGLIRNLEVQQGLQDIYDENVVLDHTFSLLTD